MLIGNTPSSVKNAVIDKALIYKSVNKINPIPMRIIPNALISKV